MIIDYKKVVLEHLNTSIEHDDFLNGDYKVYTESTADGYDLFVITEDPQNPSITEDVHYYDSDLASSIIEEVLAPGYSVYIDQYLYEDLYMDDAFEEYFNSNVEDIVKSNPDSFTKEELKFIKNEYSIDDEE
tara:strand:+ start:301 stop:696 length:396 start_codon:yes stop_codon:yes gene_type:complete